MRKPTNNGCQDFWLIVIKTLNVCFIIPFILLHMSTNTCKKFKQNASCVKLIQIPQTVNEGLTHTKIKLQ